MTHRIWLSVLLCACGSGASSSSPDAAPPRPVDASVPDAGPPLAPVYHFMGTYFAEHFYTGDAREVPGLQLQGVSFYLASGPAAGLVPLYRFFSHTCGHVLSTDIAGNGCRDCDAEGVLGYIATSTAVAPAALHDLDGSCYRAYPVDDAELQFDLGLGYIDKGTIGYAWRCGPGDACCKPSCAGRVCGADDFCGGTCAAGSGCCARACAGVPCGAPDGCGSFCWEGSGCTTTAFAGAWPDRAVKMAVLPSIGDNSVPPATELADMKATLGGGGPAATLGFSQETAYCYEIERSLGWSYDATRLRALLQASQDANMPVLIHLNGGHWCRSGLHNRRTGINLEKDLWRDDQIAWGWTPGAAAPVPYRQPDDVQGAYASYSRLFDDSSPATYRYWKRRFLTQAAQAIVAFYARPGVKPLLAGVSLDSETQDSTLVALDYNATFVEEWRQYLQGSGIYGPGGRWNGQGRAPALTLAQLNALFGTSYTKWADVAPPPPPPAGAVSFTPLWHEWTRFRVEAAHHLTEDMAGWIVEGGLPAELIYNHQSYPHNFGGTIEGAYFLAADDLFTSGLANGAGGGITYYSASERDTGVFALARAYGGRWGVFEYNPLDCGGAGDEARDLAQLVALRENGAGILCPMAWPDEPGNPLCGLNVKSSPFGRALAKLLADPTPRPAFVDPAAPGTAVFRFGDHFAEARASGPDTHLVASAMVGTVAEAAIYQKPAGSLTFPAVVLPAGRVVLRFDAGLDNAAVFGGDGVEARVLVAGVPVLDFVVGPEDTWWHRWRPFLVDLSSVAGKTVDITLEVGPRANATGDDFLWGNAVIYDAAR